LFYFIISIHCVRITYYYCNMHVGRCLYLYYIGLTTTFYMMGLLSFIPNVKILLYLGIPWRLLLMTIKSAVTAVTRHYSHYIILLLNAYYSAFTIVCVCLPGLLCCTALVHPSAHRRRRRHRVVHIYYIVLFKLFTHASFTSVRD